MHIAIAPPRTRRRRLTQATHGDRLAHGAPPAAVGSHQRCELSVAGDSPPAAAESPAAAAAAQPLAAAAALPARSASASISPVANRSLTSQGAAPAADTAQLGSPRPPEDAEIEARGVS